MASKAPIWRVLRHARPGRHSKQIPRQCRQFAVTAERQTDGVFRALTENRVQTPWIEALRKKQREGQDPTQASGKQETPSDRDLSPRKMSDSYHSVVRQHTQKTSARPLTDASDVDTTVSARSMASRYLPQQLRPYSAGYHLHGP